MQAYTVIRKVTVEVEAAAQVGMIRRRAEHLLSRLEAAVTDMTSDTIELAWRFAEETDAIALPGAAPDCTERIETLNA